MDHVGGSIVDSPAVRFTAALDIKCREKTNSNDVEQVTMENGRQAARSTCVVCGTRKFRIGEMPA